MAAEKKEGMNLMITVRDTIEWDKPLVYQRLCQDRCKLENGEFIRGLVVHQGEKLKLAEKIVQGYPVYFLYVHFTNTEWDSVTTALARDDKLLEHMVLYFIRILTCHVLELDPADLGFAKEFMQSRYLEALTLINEVVIKSDEKLLPMLIKYPAFMEALDGVIFRNECSSQEAEIGSAILTNLTRSMSTADFICEKYPTHMKRVLHQLYKLRTAYKDTISIGVRKNSAMTLCNMSRTQSGRSILLDKDTVPVLNLVWLISEGENTFRRFIAATVKNCLFDIDEHEWLVENADVVSTLVKPLAGPDVFTDDEYKDMPPELQFLDNDKERESDQYTRLLLLKGLYKLCMTKAIREKMRKMNIYLILREYHKWEKNAENLELLENVVNILIQTEEEIGVDDYHDAGADESSAQRLEHIESAIVPLD